MRIRVRIFHAIVSRSETDGERSNIRAHVRARGGLIILKCKKLLCATKSIVRFDVRYKEKF